MDTVRINRAPVLTLWAAVVAERLGFDRDEALTLGKAVAGLMAQSKGQRLGILTPAPEAIRRQRARKAKSAGVPPVALLGRAVQVVQPHEGLRAVGKDHKPVTAAAVDKYLASRFGDALPATRLAMEKLAKSMKPDVLADQAFGLYEKFRPEVPEGETGWGAKGVLSLRRIGQMAGRS
jgi:hypothetical protein